MYNLDSKKYPLFSVKHLLDNTDPNVTRHFFIDNPKVLPDREFPAEFKTLSAGTPVIVLEDRIGFKALWTKIKVPTTNQVGYVKHIAIKSINQETPPFFAPNVISVKKEDLPDYTLPEIEWYRQEPYVVYDDPHNGTYAVQYDFPEVTSINGKDDLAIYMRQAHVTGTMLILQDRGLSFDQQTIELLTTQDVNKQRYYYFSRAEEWYIDPRPCSNLKVLVSVPKRFINAAPSPLRESQEQNPNAILGEPIRKPTDQYFKKEFKNYSEFKKFFSDLEGTLNHYNIALQGRTWKIEPFGTVLALNVEAMNVKKFAESINQFLELNIAPLFVFAKNDLASTPEPSWLGTLELVINKTNLVIENIKFKTYPKNIITSVNERLNDPIFFMTPLPDILADKGETVEPYLALNKGLKSFLGNPLTKDKTIINYITEFNNEIDTASPLFSAFDTEQKLSQFLSEKHFPTITFFEFEELDLLRCAVDNSKRIRDLALYKIPTEIKKFSDLRDLAVKNQNKIESDSFTAASLNLNLNLVSDPSMRVLFGLDEPEGRDVKEKIFNFITIANRVDWAKYLAFASACLQAKLTPAEYQQLLADYKNAKKFTDTLAANTICNPYLTNALKIINMIQLPELPTINPNASLITEIENAISKLMQDVLQQTIKLALMQAAKACLSDPNADYNGDRNQKPSPGEALGDLAGTPALDDIIEDFGGDPRNPNNADKVLNDLTNMLDDIVACLSTDEICKLFNGRSINDDALAVISGLINRKYPEYASRFNDRKFISEFFDRLGSKIDLSICDDILDGDDTSIASPFSNALCDDGRIQQLREGLLADKGLDEELINDLLNGIKEKEKKNLEDVLKLLNSDNPLDLQLSPDMLCKLLPEGSTLGIPDSSLNTMLNTLLDPVHNAFNEEAIDWPKTTYSIKSDQKEVFEFINGKIVAKTPVGGSLIPTSSFGTQGDTIRALSGKETDKTKLEGNSNKVNELSSGGATSEIKLPGYIFKNAISPDGTKFSTNNEKVIFSTTINGGLQQRLDLNLPLDTYRAGIYEAEKSLIEFVKSIFYQIEAKLVVDNISLDALLEKSGKTIMRQLLVVMDIFLSSNLEDKHSIKLYCSNFYKQLNLTKANEANAFFAASEGAPIYKKLFEKIIINKQILQNFIREISSTNTISVLNPNIIVTDISDNASGSLNTKLSNSEIKYRNVEKNYETIINSCATYPDYNLALENGLVTTQDLQPLSIEIGTRQIILGSGEEFTPKTNIKNGQLYDFYKLKVFKNGKNYILINGEKLIDNSVLKYAKDDLRLNVINKNSTFQAFIETSIKKFGFSGKIINPSRELLKEKALTLEEYEKQYLGFYEKYFNDSEGILRCRLDESYNYFFSSLKEKMLSSENKFLKLKETSSSSQGKGQPYTQYLKLVIPQTTNQKLCDIKPNYLDIDAAKNDMKSARTNCPDTTVREYSDKPVNTNDLDKLPLDDMQTGMLAGLYNLSIRTYLHDLMLRAIYLFGIYDPQTLKNNDLYINLMTDLMESEMRATDFMQFNMLSSYLFTQFKKQNSSLQDLDAREGYYKKIALRLAVKEQLNSYVIPKLTKRIDVDTNATLLSIPESSIKLINFIDDIKSSDLILIQNNSVYIKINTILTNKQGDFELSFYQKVFVNTNTQNNNTWLEFKNSTEYKVLFDYIFDPRLFFQYIFFINCFSNSTNKQNLNTFYNTKKQISKAVKNIVTKGNATVPDLNNAQDVANEDPFAEIIKFIIKTLLTAPIKILKGYTELTEPNIALTSGIYKAAKLFKPDLTSFIIPATSIPLGLIPTPVTCPLPFINPILATVYFATLAWYDDDYPTGNKSNKEALDGLLENIDKSDIDCAALNAQNPDATANKQIIITNGISTPTN